MKQRITLRLVNDEKKKTRSLSAKACTTDTATCAPGATDVCLSLDIAACYGSNSRDYCKYIDAAACMAGSYDYCYYDHQACHNGNSDTCMTDD